LLAELLTQRNAVDALMTNVGAATRQISAVIGDNRTQLKPALDKLNNVLGVLDNRRKELQRTLYLIPKYAMSFGEVLGSGPFFKASLPNLTLGQFVQPFTDAAFSDLGLDPNTLLPSQLVDPGNGQAGLPLLPLPYPRTGPATRAINRAVCPAGRGLPAATRTGRRHRRRRRADRRRAHPRISNRRPSKRRCTSRRPMKCPRMGVADGIRERPCES
jgi:hypothetical protein